MGWVTNPVSLLLMGFESATVIFGPLRMVGTGLVLVGRRLGAWPLVTGGAGVVASTLPYSLFLPVVMVPVVEATGEPGDYSHVRHYHVGFAPA